MASIWPGELAHGTEVPVRTLGRTLVLEHRPATDIPAIVHAVPRPPGDSIVEDRLRVALAACGYRVASHFRRDHLETAEALTPFHHPNPPCAVDIEPTTGLLTLWGAARGHEVMNAEFWSASYLDDPNWGWGVGVVIEDITRTCTDKPPNPLHPRDWEIDDRDRWLAWAGFAPLEMAP